MTAPYYQDDLTTIYHGDSRELLPTMPRVDLVLTDPPYGIDYDPLRRKHWSAQTSTKNGEHRNARDYGAFAWDKEPFEPAPILNLDRPSIIWGANNFASRLPDFGSWLCWDKITRNDLQIRQAECELAWANCLARSRIFRHLWSGGYRASESGTPNYHPTQKPIALMAWCLGLVKGVRTVIDPYMGSGTTLRAAKDAGIKAIGIEIDERYCEIAASRMSQEVLAFEPAAEVIEQGELYAMEV